MSARRAWVMSQSGCTGTLLPHEKGLRAGLTMRTRKGGGSGSVRVRLCQMLPVTVSTSSMPYNAEPAVSGTATISVSRGWHERTVFGTNASYPQEPTQHIVRSMEDMHMATTTEGRTMNGLDTSQLTTTAAALKANPALAQFEFRARNRWISGGENRSTIKDFFGAGAEDTSRRTAFEFTNGEPPVLLGDNEGANPVEFLLHALAGCVTTTTVLHAAARGIQIERLSTRLVGDIDLQGLLALADVPAGYRQIRIEMDIVAANAGDQELDDLLRFAQDHSPVCNTVCQPVPVILERVRR